MSPAPPGGERAEEVNPFVHDALPGRVVFGVGAVDRVADEVARLGLRRVLVVASGSAKAVGDRIAAALGDRHAGDLGDVRQHVPADLAAAARRTAREVAADAVVTVGGGSAIGLGKAVAVDPDAPDGGVTVVAVPTTYSGSEMTPIYGITGVDADRHPPSIRGPATGTDLYRVATDRHKQTGRDLRALPRLVVYDPALTVDLPPGVTAASGFNALAHCVEALYAPGTDPVVQLHAGAGLAVLAGALPSAVERPDDLAARGRMLYGAYLAGAALAVAGTALHHKLCHVLGGTFDLVHGDVNAVVLPHVVAYNAAAAPDAVATIAAALDARDGDDAATALWHLASRVGAPPSLAALGMPADGLDLAAERGVAETGATNPRRPDVASVRALLQRAFDGSPPTETPLGGTATGGGA
jgi:maleylacetate reductase